MDAMTSSTTSGARKRTDEDRKTQILDAARAVFDEKGVENATISDVVRRAGVAQGTFYLYFASKRDAVIELARRPMEEIAARVSAAAVASASFEEMLRAMLKIAFEFERPNMDLCRMISQVNSSSKASWHSTPMMVRMHEQMVGIYTQAMAAGEMIQMDPEMAAVMFHMILSGALAEASASNDPAYSRQAEEATMTILINAFVQR